MRTFIQLSAATLAALAVLSTPGIANAAPAEFAQRASGIGNVPKGCHLKTDLQTYADVWCEISSQISYYHVQANYCRAVRCTLEKGERVPTPRHSHITVPSGGTLKDVQVFAT